MVQPSLGSARAQTTARCESTPTRALPEEFEWGYHGAGPDVLAEAILADRLGWNPDPALTTAFAREVVAGLEREFELPGSQIDDWLSRRLAAV